MEYYLAIKRTCYCHLNKRDGNNNHHISSNKPGTERQVPHDLTHMWNLKKLISLEGENRMVVTRTGKSGRGGRIEK
jgi:hypothetical protein